MYALSSVYHQRQGFLTQEPLDIGLSDFSCPSTQSNIEQAASLFVQAFSDFQLQNILDLRVKKKRHLYITIYCDI